MDKFFGFYRGIVVQHLTNGYVKVVIPGIIAPDDGNYLDVNPDLLPVCEVASNLLGGGISGKDGELSLPDLFSNVWCFFENGDINRPVCFASSMTHNADWNNPLVEKIKNETPTGLNLKTTIPQGKITRIGGTYFVQSSITADDNRDNPTKNVIILNTDHYNNSSSSSSSGGDNETSSTTTESISKYTYASISLYSPNGVVLIKASDAIILDAPKVLISSNSEDGFVELSSEGKVRIKSQDDTILENKSILNESVFNIDFRTPSQSHSLRSQDTQFAAENG